VRGTRFVFFFFCCSFSINTHTPIRARARTRLQRRGDHASLAAAIDGLADAEAMALRIRAKVTALTAWLPTLEKRIGERVEEAAKAKRLRGRFLFSLLIAYLVFPRHIDSTLPPDFVIINVAVLGWQTVGWRSIEQAGPGA
jgi:hypothetical protein